MYATMLFLDKMTSNWLLVITIMTLSLVSCQVEDDMSSYYFPLQDLEEGLVYNYVSSEDNALEDENWFYKSLLNATDTVLIGQFYGISGRIEQLIIEKTVSSGVFQDSLILYVPGPDSTDIGISTQLGPASVFPFFRSTKDTLRYKVIWTDPSDSLQYTLIKKKVFERDTTYTFEQQSRKALHFKTFVSVETFRDDMGMTQSEWKGEEVFAQGIGLVYYSQSISPEFTKAYRLEKRYAMDDFLERLTKF